MLKVFRKALIEVLDYALCRRWGLQTFKDWRVSGTLFGDFSAGVQHTEIDFVVRLLSSVISKQMGILRRHETANAYSSRGGILTTRLHLYASLSTYFGCVNQDQMKGLLFTSANHSGWAALLSVW